MILYMYIARGKVIQHLGDKVLISAESLYHLIILPIRCKFKPEDHWSCIAHLITEDMLKSAVIEEKTFKHSPWAEADNPLQPKC